MTTCGERVFADLLPRLLGALDFTSTPGIAGGLNVASTLAMASSRGRELKSQRHFRDRRIVQSYLREGLRIATFAAHLLRSDCR